MGGGGAFALLIDPELFNVRIMRLFGRFVFGGACVLLLVMVVVVYGGLW